MTRHLLLATVLFLSALPALGAPPPAAGTPGTPPGPGAGSPSRRGKPAEFQPTEMTEDEAAAQALKARQKNRPVGWKDTEAAPDRPIPWMLIAFAGLAVFVTLPFAMRAYNQTRNTIEEVELASGGPTASGSRIPKAKAPPKPRGDA